MSAPFLCPKKPQEGALKTYHSMAEALPFLIEGAYHVRIVREILFELYHLEQLLACGEQESTVVILETEHDYAVAEGQYRLTSRIPESREKLEADGETWLKTVYITDDAGNGIVSFQRAPLRTEK